MSMSTMSAAAAPTYLTSDYHQQYHQNHNQQQQQQQPPPPSTSEQLCYVHCNISDTVLAVSVPSASLYKTVTVRCGHCTHLLPVNMCALIQLPPPPSSPSAAAAPSPFNFPHPFISPTTTAASPHNNSLLDEIQSPGANLMMFNQHHLNSPTNNSDHLDELSRPPPLVVNRRKNVTAYLSLPL